VPAQPHRNRESPGKAAFLSSTFLLFFKRIESLSSKLDAVTRFSAPLLLTGLVRLAKGNCSWGYDRIVGVLAHLGYTISDQTVGNILKRHGIPPAPERKTTTTWKEFIRTHMHVLVATDFFTAEVWTLGGLVTYYVLFFIQLGTREVHVAGVTPHPHQTWMM
jgi:hypothetical protein